PASVHEVGAHETGEGQRTFHPLLIALCQAQQQEGDERNGDLDPYGVLAGAEEVADSQRLLDPPEEQFDSPAPLVEIGDFSSRRVKVVAQDAQHLTRLGSDANLANGIAERVSAIS